MTKLTRQQADTIIAAALAKADDLELKPLVVAILDDGGHLRAFSAQDGTTPGRFEIASGKARGALLMGTGSRALHNQAAERPHFLAALSASIPGGVVPVPGGVLVRNQAGETLGAVGISGDTSDNDEACAAAGIDAAGLEALTG